MTGHTAPFSASCGFGWSGGKTAETEPTIGQVASMILLSLVALFIAGHSVASGTSELLVLTEGWLWMVFLWCEVVALVTGQRREESDSS